MTLDHSGVSENSAVDGGGGMFSCCGVAPVALNQSTISDNAATVGSGGGIYDFSGRTPLYKTTVSGNNPDNCDPPADASGCTG
jgi:hypothetical protein